MEHEVLSDKVYDLGLNTTYETALKDFEIRFATSDAALEQCFRLRHQVYCVEHAYEAPRSGAEAMEFDQYDQCSVHALVIHKPTGMVAGTVRLILPESDLRPPLPMLALTGEEDIPFPLAFTAEISRFAISKEFRKLIAQSSQPVGSTARSLNRDIVILCLIRAFVELAALHGVYYFCALKERSLIRRVSRLGIHFDPIGPEIECRGKRTPCMVSAAEMLARARSERPDVWRIITDDGRLADAFCLPLAAE